MPPALFVTGTDTDVGKSLVAAALTLGLKGAYWKPIQSGVPTDREWVQRVTGLDERHFFPEAYTFSQPLSPHAAARCEGRFVEMQKIQLPDFSPLIVEGAGGVMVPLNEQHMMLDLMKQLNIPALVVARSTLGTLNHTLMTLHMLRARQIPILGVVLNGPLNPSNKEAIIHYGKVQVLAEIEPLPTIDREALKNIFFRP